MKNNNGFTLVEVLAVLVVLGVVSIIFIPNTIKILKENNLTLDDITIINANHNFSWSNIVKFMNTEYDDKAASLFLNHYDVVMISNAHE